MKKVVIIIISIVLAILAISIGAIYFIDSNLKLKSIKVVNYDSEKEMVTISVEKEKGILFSKKFKCSAIDGENIVSVDGSKNKCEISIPIEKNYKIVLSNKNKKSKEYVLTDYVDNRIDFKFQSEVIYLALEEEANINYIDRYIVNESNPSYTFISGDEKIVKIVDNKLVGVSAGTTTVKESTSEEELEVIVTDLIIKPTTTDRAEIIPCNKYNDEENALLDKILESKVNEAGYKTRAGAVAAARFLTLQFPYRIPYFYENGRLADGGINYVDGEGRYYHKGLYLSQIKKNDIVATFSGPSIWGCPLCNWEDDPYFGYVEGRMKPNGLDCSGFVSWALVNGGFDPGDIGAGETPDAYQMTDLGEFVKLDSEILESGRIKVGDLFNYWGHISIIIGYDGEYYYVAESLPDFDGADVRIYNHEEALDMFRYVVLMDAFYKEDGNYSEMWN